MLVDLLTKWEPVSKIMSSRGCQKSCSLSPHYFLLHNQKEKRTFQQKIIIGKTWQKQCLAQKNHSDEGFCWVLFSSGERGLFVQLCCKPVLSPYLSSTTTPPRNQRGLSSPTKEN